MNPPLLESATATTERLPGPAQPSPELTTPSGTSASRINENDDQVGWIAASNPSGTTYHIERSIVSGVSDFVEITTMTDALQVVVPYSYTVDSWYRVKASKAGYTTTPYSSVYFHSVP